jgi:gamma-glutamyltranspeptidase / glutathione hydrolase
MRNRLIILLMQVFAMVQMSFGQTPTIESRSAQAKSSESWHAKGKQGAVVAGGGETVEIGLATLKSGGNAADAAAATIIALSVTDSRLFCFGGEMSIIVYDAKQKQVNTICGLGVAPKLATREFFADKGIPTTGVQSATVPATLDACVTLLSRYGTKTFADVAQPTIAMLEKRPEPWHADLARTLTRLVGAENSAIGNREARLQKVSDYFYRGPIAQEIASWCAANGGLIREEDLAAHKTRFEPPVSANYRGHTVYKCGPWTQGPWLLESLQLLEGFDLKSLGHNSPDAIHLIVEAMKLGLADRDVYYADPAFVDVPINELLAPSYAALRRPLIDMKKASLKQQPGDPKSGKELLDAERTRFGLGNTGHDTTTCLVADDEGNVIAATPSGWDGVLVGDTGIWLGSRLQSFNTWADHPNCIAPGKRPRITLTPTLVLKDDKPVLAVSVAGGDGQDQAAIQMLTDVIDFGMSPREAVTAVRFGTNHLVGSFGQAPPQLGSLLIYSEVGSQTIDALKARGHQVKLEKSPMWHPVVLAIDPASGEINVAGDPKANRHAAAY